MIPVIDNIGIALIRIVSAIVFFGLDLASRYYQPDDLEAQVEFSGHLYSLYTIAFTAFEEWPEQIQTMIIKQGRIALILLAMAVYGAKVF